MINVPYLDKLFNKFLNGGVHDAHDGLTSSLPAILCIVFAMIASGRQYLGHPITCWTPSEFQKGWEDYTNQYCFIQSTYYVSFDAEMYPEHHLRPQSMHNIYQWVPVIFFVQAILLFLPNWIWRLIYRKNDMRVKNIITNAMKANDANKTTREEIFNKMTFPILETIEMRTDRDCNAQGFISHWFSSTVLTYCYILMKAVRVLVNISMFCFVANLLHVGDAWWPIKALVYQFSDSHWENSPSFPRVTMCDFQTFNLANVVNHTAQCLLMLNAINEKTFLFEWVMFVITTGIGLYSLWHWVRRVSSYRPVKTITQWLQNTRAKGLKFTEEEVKMFLDTIGLDVYFILLMIETKSGRRNVSAFTRHLYEEIQKPKIVPDENKEVIDWAAHDEYSNDFYAAEPLPDKTHII